MRHYRHAFALALSFALLCAAAGRGAAAYDARATGEVAVALAPLRVVGKTGGRLSEIGSLARVVVKFRDDAVHPALAEAALASAKPGSLVAAVAEAALPGGVESTFDRSAEELRAEEARLERATGVDLADLSRYYDVETASPEAALALARRLETFDEVEFAYVQPEMLPASLGDASLGGPAGEPRGATTTPDLTPFQFYLDRAPGGIGVAPLRDKPGGRGEGVKIVDVQYSWNLDHEDLPFHDGRTPIVAVSGFDPTNDRNHGTAVLGMLVGAENDYGITGICPAAEIGVMNPQPDANTLRLARTIDDAATLLSRDGERGNLLQLELQARGVNAEIALLPPEWDPVVFDAIQRAVARGVVVVEPAGNGGLKGGRPAGISLDRSELGGAFNRKKRDSGAIVVGGGFPIDASRTLSSNYGSRVDVQGYGAFVTTLGYGDLYTGGSPLRAYTGGFSGTSSAVPCVTGAAVLVQSSLKAAGLAPLTSPLLRALIAGSGSPDGSLPGEPIGPRPNAAVAAAAATDPSTPFITSIKYKQKKDRLVIEGLYFPGADAPPDRRARVYIGDVAVDAEVPAGYEWTDGSTTRLQVTGVGGLLPRKTILYVSVGAGDEVRSPQRIFIRR
jgi:hypothetical protein